MIPALVQWNWWLRWTETRVITDEGVYADNRVPEDYGGPELTVKVIQQVILCTESAHFMRLRFGNTADVKDADRNGGLGIYIQSFGYSDELGYTVPEETIIGAGPSENLVIWESAENTMLNADLKARLTSAYIIAKTHLEK